MADVILFLTLILLLDYNVYDSKWSFQYGERGGLIRSQDIEIHKRK